MDEVVPPRSFTPTLTPFMKAFELVCQHLEIAATLNLFLTLFTVQRGVGERRGQGWVSFRQNKKIFFIFISKVKSFKDPFFLVRSRSEAALNNVMKLVDRP